MDADKITDATGGDFTVTVTGTAIQLQAANNGAIDADLATALGADIAVAEKAPAGRAAGMTITNPNAMTQTLTDGAAGANAASVAINLDGFDVDKAGTVVFTIGGQDFEVEITEAEVNDKVANPLDDIVAGKLVTALNAAKITDAGAGDFTATATGSAITLTSANQAPMADATVFGGNIAIAEKPADPADPADPAAGNAAHTGTFNVGTGKNVQGTVESPGQLASTSFDLTADIVKDGATITIGNDTYTFKVGKDSTVKDGKNVIDLSDFEVGDAELLHNAKELLSRQDNEIFTIGYDQVTGKMSVHEKVGNDKRLDELSDQAKFDEMIYANTVSEGTAGKSLVLQVGDTADDFQKVSLDIKDMSTKGLGIEGLSISTQEDASDAISKIKNAINLVSSQRGDLGAIQNRLEHTINNLGVQAENITAAESRIRDTDMAEEMMAYTKNNILVQAAQAMLAQANQVPQGILQLLQ